PRSAEEYRKALEANERAADRMNRVIQDLLLLARSDTHRLDLQIRPTRVVDVVEQSLDALGPAEAFRVEVQEIAPDLSVRGDSVQLVRLLTNLLQNSVRYTPAAGRVTVAARRSGQEVALVVEDTGIGIPPEHLPRICERFYRVDSARARGEGGTGLGLAICQSIAEAHGGRLTIVSHVGKGTVVTVSLPAAQMIAEPATAGAIVLPAAAPHSG
ncbi:MAG TPA: ATP-binding protein, partial [Chthonomonadales bacterium]|nr:ATP-binding protein [Chthonomonadales bacterium]